LQREIVFILVTVYSLSGAADAVAEKPSNNYFDKSFLKKQAQLN